jgi:DNA-directed RNA polymerase subunit beta'
MFDINTLAAMQVGLASPETIRKWSHGEVTKPETINYRSQKPEMGGLFCEKIFGPAKDYECHCGKYKKIRYQGITCEKCGVEVISKEWRRERFGHIELVSPCSHIWYLKGIPSRMGLVLDVSPKQLEEVIYFAAHIVLSAGTSTILKYKDFLDEKVARLEFVDAISAFKNQITAGSADSLKAEELIAKMQNPGETFDFFTNAAFITKYTGAEFGEGASAVKRLLYEVDLDKEFEGITKEIRDFSGQRRQAP